MTIDLLADPKVTVRQLKLSILDGLLRQCDPDQQEFFKRMYPTMPNDAQLFTAIDQCRRTVMKNRAAAPVVTDEMPVQGAPLDG